ncbi:hypothetical protein [Nocardia salmonicida]|uniref:hypothetical protein n=1 Tax=Nocardia salmonicida TaxID=53431 RepID=UPI003787F7AF
MPALDPSTAVATCEDALRQLIAHIYQDAHGPDWLDTVVARAVTPTRIEKWKERAEVEARVRGAKGVAAVPDGGLAYAEFYDLTTILEKSPDWSIFEPALGKKPEIIAYLKRFNHLRNTVAHTRPLVPFEQDLLSGVAGQIRNQVTVYMSKKDPAGEHYPRIESVRDSFGHEIIGTMDLDEVAGMQMTEMILRPGDQVSFTMIGTDPQDRPLRWWLSTKGVHRLETTSQHGQPAEITWHVTDDDVVEHAGVQIFMECATSKYHRYYAFDHRVYFRYIVRPPRSALSS